MTKPLTNWEVKKALKDNGMTLSDLQRLTGINRSILSWATTGRVNLTSEEKRKIAVALQKTEAELFCNI